MLSVNSFWSTVCLGVGACDQQAMYERMFCWIVGRINDVIEVKNYDAKVHGKNTVIGVLDIYGFEIFQNNRLGAMSARNTST